MEEAVEGQIILEVRVRPETMRVDQENDMSSRWSCEKFAEASLMRLLTVATDELLFIKNVGTRRSFFLT